MQRKLSTLSSLSRICSGQCSSYPGKTYVFDFQKAWEKIGKHDILIGGDFKQEEFTQSRKYLKNYHDHNSVDTSKGKNGLFQVNTGKAQKIAKISENKSKEKKNKTTVAELTALSEQGTVYESLVNDVYSKVYKTMKIKLDAAQSMLATLSKLLSKRMQDAQMVVPTGMSSK